MKGEAQPLIKYFDGSDKRFIVPLYQRNYDWTTENCIQLFEDLIKLHSNPSRKSHFFGSIVSYVESGSEIRYIIDGQQRITTISLLLIALVNAANEGRVRADDPKLVEKIFKRYIVDEYQEDERKVKLKPIKKDMDSFDALIFKGKEKHIQTSNVTKNYNFFFEKITQYGLTVDEYFNCVKKLEIINIKLDGDDDPQLIFESLNSTGLDLKESDKIRNYLLMSLSPDEQDELYTKYWNPIEELTGYEPTSFVRDYLTMKKGQITRLDKIYFAFKSYAENNTLSRQELLAEMHHFATIYNKITDAAFGSGSIDAKLKQMVPLEPTVAYPFLLSFFEYAEGRLSDSEKYSVLDLVENYYARRIICNEQSNALNKVFCTLHREVINLMDKFTEAKPESQSPSYLSVMAYQLLHKSGSSKFPEDMEVSENFATRQVYKMPGNFRAFILERLENRDNKERHDVVNMLASKDISIEHIMPQTLSEDWKKALGTEWEDVHKQYLHTMANLTLTGYNSTYSNNKFQDKRDMQKGFKDSAFRLNNYVKQCDKWTREELETRQKELLDVFFSLWPMPETSFEPVRKEVESATLDDVDFEFTGKKLTAFSFRGVRQTVPSWKEMLVSVCAQVYLERRSTVEWICASDKCFMHAADADGRTEFAPGLFVWSANSTESKMSILRSLFDECGIDQMELSFEFNSAVQGADDVVDPAKADGSTRQRKNDFWAGFLEYAREDESFNANFRFHDHVPHYSYDLSVGRSGISIYLVVNKSCVVAGFYFSRKETMAPLFAKKDEINSRFSYEPIWESFEKAGTITQKRPFNLNDKESYLDGYKWLIARAVELKRIVLSEI